MNKFYVEVNGKSYEILIRESAALPANDGQSLTPVPADQNDLMAAASVVVEGTVSGGEAITAPLAGTILKVNVNSGMTVKRGDVLMVMEAMKMENEIMAHKDGTITSVAVLPGASVESGSSLCSILS